MDCDNCHRPLADHDENGYCPECDYSRFELEFNSSPVCPHCGDADDEWWDGTHMRHDEDEEVRTCANCGREYVAIMHQTVEFTTTVRNPKKEAEEQARRDAETERHRQWCLAMDEAAALMPPGTRVREKDKEGVIADRERQRGRYIEVQFDGDRHTLLRDPTRLEVVCGRDDRPFVVVTELAKD